MRDKEWKKMSEEQKTTRVSSAYTRVVGQKQLDVVNTKQTENLPKKAYQSKWCVLMTHGNRRAIIAQTDKKYDSIAALLAKEIELKNEQKAQE